jgi:hypothetical protein
MTNGGQDRHDVPSQVTPGHDSVSKEKCKKHRKSWRYLWKNMARREGERAQLASPPGRCASTRRSLLARVSPSGSKEKKNPRKHRHLRSSERRGAAKRGTGYGRLHQISEGAPRQGPQLRRPCPGTRPRRQAPHQKITNARACGRLGRRLQPLALLGCRASLQLRGWSPCSVRVQATADLPTRLSRYAPPLLLLLTTIPRLAKGCILWVE